MKTRGPVHRVAIVTVLLAVTMTGLASSDAPSVSELLDRYTQTMNATQSFIDTYEAAGEFEYMTPRSPQPMVDGKKSERGQHRFDGRRTYWQCYTWGDINARKRDVPESTPHYDIRIEADGELYAHSRTVNDPQSRGTATWQRLPGKTSALWNRPYSGILGFLGTGERLDTTLRHADQISVRQTTETINGSACYIIDADTKSGQYTVWLDPEHGYLPARAKRKATEGDWQREAFLPAGSHITESVDNIRFEQVDGVWVAMEGDQSNDLAFENGAYFSKEKSHFRRTSITLNPDHDKLRSFADPRQYPAQDPELRNGTRVRMYPSPLRYVWVNGEIVVAEN